MKLKKSLSHNAGSCVAVLSGILVFTAVTGGAIILPGNIDWLMVGDDGATHYIGWEFYRQGPLFQVPPGANPGYGMEISSSIVFSDSVPLVAMALKPLSTWLPYPFQYLGLWVFACFILQAWFSYHLLSLFTTDNPLRLIGTCFYLTAPVFLFRVSISHYAGSGHWILIAALYFYLGLEFRPRSWLALLGVASLVNAYLLVMAGGIFAAEIARRLFSQQLSLRSASLISPTAAIVVLTAAWASGYFMVSKYTAGQGFGYYRMNLLSPVNPLGSWSILLPSFSTTDGDAEGFAYLGLGMFGLLLVGIIFLIRNAHRAEVRTLVPLVIITTSCALFALSNRLAIGTWEINLFELPPKAWPLVSSFRASGRFFWPMYYLIYAAAFYGIVRVPRKNTARCLAATMLCIQLADVSVGGLLLRNKLHRPEIWVSPMQSEVWNEFAARYSSLVVIQPAKHHADYMPLSHFAVSHGMNTNAVYFARVNEQRLRDLQNALSKRVHWGRFDEQSLYIFSDDELWKVAKATAAPSDYIESVDGFRVLAPRFRLSPSARQLKGAEQR